MGNKLFEELLLEYNKAYMYAWVDDKDLVDRFWKIKTLLGNRNEADINWWIQNKTPDEFEKFVNDYETGIFKTNTQVKKSSRLHGAELIYDDHKYWRVYFVTDYEAAKQLGRNTQWCITGHNDDASYSGEHYFNEYITEVPLLNAGYYFCFDLTNKNNNNDYSKYCILIDSQNKINSIWDDTDLEIDKIPVLSEEQAIQFISGIELPYNIYNQNHFVTTYVGWNIIDKKEDKVLLLLDKFLAEPDRLIFQPYNKEAKVDNLSWATSDLRRWLLMNLDLYFTGEEQQKLITTKVLSTPVPKRFDVDQGPETVDKIFLLSAPEASKYSQQSEENKKAILNWGFATWLRSISEPMNDIQTAMFIYSGKVDVVGEPVDSDSILVRPACWFKIK